MICRVCSVAGATLAQPATMEQFLRVEQLLHQESKRDETQP